jgi:hypothetical protein
MVNATVGKTGVAFTFTFKEIVLCTINFKISIVNKYNKVYNLAHICKILYGGIINEQK